MSTDWIQCYVRQKHCIRSSTCSTRIQYRSTLHANVVQYDNNTVWMFRWLASNIGIYTSDLMPWQWELQSRKLFGLFAEIFGWQHWHHHCTDMHESHSLSMSNCRLHAAIVDIVCRMCTNKCEWLDVQQKWVIEMTMDVNRIRTMVCGWYSHSWNLFRKTTVRESDKWMIYCITKAHIHSRDVETVSHTDTNHTQWPMRKSSIKRLLCASVHTISSSSFVGKFR